ncbi:B12-binding domain-containing radical SAM protein [Candidatus Shapirobacteria bacterium]|nr:B12-binding domain-containing radical SAM protein [Candidatus Shapirobacteria bacterium]
MSKKVILFFPSPLPYERNWHGVPLALLAISRYLVNENYDIKIYTRYLQKNYERKLLKSGKNAICLGISAMTGHQIYDGLRLAKKFKKKYPKVPIVWGGWHPSILPLETIKDHRVDIVVKGQGDITFTELVHALESKSDLKNVKGIVFKKGKKIIATPDRRPVDLTTVPPLPYHLVDVSQCTIPTEYGLRTAPYISSYGCPHRCAFCVEEIVNKRSWKAVPAEKVLNEWEGLYRNYGADSIAVYDSNFFVDENRVREICEGLIHRNLPIKFGNANGRAGQLSRYKPETWELMEKAGCTMILTGAESGDQKSLDFISKDMNVEEIVKFTELCHKHNIKILYSFLVGLPWSKDPQENDEFVATEYRSTLSLIDRLLKICNRNRYTYYVFLPYPGAALYNRAVGLGLEAPKSFEDWTNYLMSPENAFKETIRQQWISPHDARLTAMLTQYIFGIMDRDTYTMLYPRLKNPISRAAFTSGYYIALAMVTVRWKLKFFDFPLDYWLFSLVHRYGGIL